MKKQIVLVTGAGSGIGKLTALSLAETGHVVYASMRDIAGRNNGRAAELRALAAAKNVQLHPLELDVLSQESADAAAATIVREQGHLDVVMQNAGHLVVGPTEAFTPDEIVKVFDTNVLGAQRVNRAVLPHLRKQGKGLVVWVSSSSTRGGTPPYLAPYFAAKAAMDSLAVSYAGELTRWGIETAIIVPGAFTRGTNHFAHAGSPADTAER